MNILFQILVAVVMIAVGYLLMPKQQVPDQKIKQGDNPTASAGTPIPMLWGTMTIKAPNCLWYGDKYLIKSKIDA